MIIMKKYLLFSMILFLTLLVFSISAHAKTYDKVSYLYINGMEEDPSFQSYSEIENIEILDILKHSFNLDKTLYANSVNSLNSELDSLKSSQEASDLSVIVIFAHGGSWDGDPIGAHYIWFGDGNRYSTQRLLDKISEIKGSKLITVASCYSGRMLTYAKQIKMQNIFIETPALTTCSSSGFNQDTFPGVDQDITDRSITKKRSMNFMFFNRFYHYDRDIGKAFDDLSYYIKNVLKRSSEEQYPNNYNTLSDFVIDQNPSVLSKIDNTWSICRYVINDKDSDKKVVWTCTGQTRCMPFSFDKKVSEQSIPSTFKNQDEYSKLQKNYFTGTLFSGNERFSGKFASRKECIDKLKAIQFQNYNKIEITNTDTNSFSGVMFDYCPGGCSHPAVTDWAICRSGYIGGVSWQCAKGRCDGRWIFDPTSNVQECLNLMSEKISKFGLNNLYSMETWSVEAPYHIGMTEFGEKKDSTDKVYSEYKISIKDDNGNPVDATIEVFPKIRNVKATILWIIPLISSESKFTGSSIKISPLVAGTWRFTISAKGCRTVNKDISFGYPDYSQPDSKERVIYLNCHEGNSCIDSSQCGGTCDVCSDGKCVKSYMLQGHGDPCDKDCQCDSKKLLKCDESKGTCVIDKEKIRESFIKQYKDRAKDFGLE